MRSHAGQLKGLRLMNSNAKLFKLLSHANRGMDESSIGAPTLCGLGAWLHRIMIHMPARKGFHQKLTHSGIC
jgi:hypothetical protein